MNYEKKEEIKQTVEDEMEMSGRVYYVWMNMDKRSILQIEQGPHRGYYGVEDNIEGAAQFLEDWMDQFGFAQDDFSHIQLMKVRGTGIGAEQVAEMFRPDDVSEAEADD